MAKRRLTRDESKAETRRQVLRAASRLFLRDGFVATSLSAIADEAGVTKGAVYSNFASKEDLFLTIVRGEGDATDAVEPEELAPAVLDRLLSVEGDLRVRLEAHGRYLSTLSPSLRQIALFLEYNAFALRNPRSTRWVAAHNGAFFDKLGAGLGEALGCDDGSDAAAIAQSLYVGLMLHRAFEPERFDEELFVKAFGLLQGLAGRA